jgi:hypothetical protein
MPAADQARTAQVVVAIHMLVLMDVLVGGRSATRRPHFGCGVVRNCKSPIRACGVRW